MWWFGCVNSMILREQKLKRYSLGNVGRLDVKEN